MTATKTITNSLIEFFYHWEKETPNKVFLRQPKGEEWETLTFAQAGQQARRITSALHEKGVKKGDHVGLISKNCQHWILTDLAIMMGGFVSVPYYASLPKHQLKQVIGLSNLKAIFVGKLEEWGDKSQVIPDEVTVIKFPHYEGNAKIDIGEKWEDLIQNFEPITNNHIPKADDLWTIKFTSGTTGTPKGVMHLHGTPVLLAQNELKTNWLGLGTVGEIRLLSFLPLNHVLERTAIETTAIALGGSISFVESLDTFANNLKDTRPTLFTAVPRIWTKFYLGVLAKFPKKRLDLLFKIPIISGILKRKIKEALGLQDVKRIFTAAAITPAFIKEFYQKLDLHLIEAYGMTETLGGVTNNPDPNSPLDSVGKAMPYAAVKIEKDTGEILLNSPYVMSGYYNNPEKTAEILKDGWIYSGDRGTIDEDGYVRVIGRVKDAFKTSKGSYVVPNPLEEIFMKNDFIEQVCVVGLGVPQPLALINLSELGLSAGKEKVQHALLQSIQEANAQAAGFEKISTAIIDKTIWSETNDFLTPTLKVKRWKLDEQYGVKYDQWYKDENKVIWI